MINILFVLNKSSKIRGKKYDYYCSCTKGNMCSTASKRYLSNIVMLNKLYLSRLINLHIWKSTSESKADRENIIKDILE